MECQRFQYRIPFQDFGRKISVLDKGILLASHIKHPVNIYNQIGLQKNGINSKMGLNTVAIKEKIKLHLEKEFAFSVQFVKKENQNEVYFNKALKYCTPPEK